MKEFLKELDRELESQNATLESFKSTLEQCPPDVRFDVDLEAALPQHTPRGLAAPMAGIRA